MPANARYGLQEGSGARNSTPRVDRSVLLTRGTRIRADRFICAQLIAIGASNPGTNRLYELTSGATSAQRARACISWPAMNCLADLIAQVQGPVEIARAVTGNRA